ncbi:MAG: hypothetical protein WAX69_12095 [Victivallales bacterium]
MKKDIAVQEVRDTRSKISARYGHSTKRLIDHYKKMEKKYSSRLIVDDSRHLVKA